MITQKQVKDLLEYNQKTGDLSWRISRRCVKAGIAGTKDKHGYIQIQVNRKIYRAHRLVWFYVYGVFPKDDIDHIDGNRLNNKIENLRAATRSENLHNSKLSKANTSGIKGVSWYPSRSQWVAYIWLNYKKHYVGYFNDIEDAKTAITKARKELHGNFANHG